MYGAMDAGASQFGGGFFQARCEILHIPKEPSALLLHANHVAAVHGDKAIKFLS